MKTEDPVIRGEYIKQHYQDLAALFQALEEAKLTVKPSKCDLFKRVVQYVGHVLKGGKLYPSRSKTEALDKWDHTTINTAEKLKGFLGLVGWYQIYIPDFAKHAAPLMEALKGKYQYEAPDPNAPKNNVNLHAKCKRVKLTPKEAKITWTQAMIDGFTHPNSALSQKISLYLPQPDQPWRIRCDVCNYAVGGALEQRQDDGNWHPVAFYSRKLQGKKANGLTKKLDTGKYAWTPREKQTYAIVCCLLKFQSWIGSQEVTVQTDHSAIVEWYEE